MLRKFCETFAKVAVFMCERKKRKLRLHETKVCHPPSEREIAISLDYIALARRSPGPLPPV